jgi:hypothetical protein
VCGLILLCSGMKFWIRTSGYGLLELLLTFESV